MEHTIRRKPATFTVAEDVLQAARDLSLNISQAAEAGIREAVREEQARQWQAQNATNIAAYNADVERRGVAIPPLWEV